MVILGGRVLLLFAMLLAFLLAHRRWTWMLDERTDDDGDDASGKVDVDGSGTDTQSELELAHRHGNEAELTHLPRPLMRTLTFFRERKA